MTSKTRNYLEEISFINDITFEESYSLFLCAIGKVYDAVGSAYVYNDGTILVAKKKSASSKKLLIKHYVVSAQKYELILKEFRNILDRYASEKSAERFAFSFHKKIIEVEIKEVKEDRYILEPKMRYGTTRGYSFVLYKRRCFINDSFKTGDVKKVFCKIIDRKKKEVTTERYNKEFCEYVFKVLFEKYRDKIDGDFILEKVEAVLQDFKKRRVLFVITWSQAPSKIFLNFLKERIKTVIAGCRFIIKERK